MNTPHALKKATRQAGLIVEEDEEENAEYYLSDEEDFMDDDAFISGVTHHYVKDVRFGPKLREPAPRRAPYHGDGSKRVPPKYRAIYEWFTERYVGETIPGITRSRLFNAIMSQEYRTQTSSGQHVKDARPQATIGDYKPMFEYASLVANTWPIEGPTLAQRQAIARESWKHHEVAAKLASVTNDIPTIHIGHSSGAGATTRRREDRALRYGDMAESRPTSNDADSMFTPSGQRIISIHMLASQTQETLQSLILSTVGIPTSGPHAWWLHKIRRLKRYDMSVINNLKGVPNENKRRRMEHLLYAVDVLENSFFSNNHSPASTLNGCNGEWTNADDTFPSTEKKMLSLERKLHALTLLLSAAKKHKQRTSARKKFNEHKGTMGPVNYAPKPRHRGKGRGGGTPRSGSKGSSGVGSGLSSTIGGLSDAHTVASYAISKVLPNASKTLPVRIPRSTGVSTQKVTSRASVDVVTGTANFGWLVFCPVSPNDKDSAQYTTATYAGIPADIADTRRGTAAPTTGVSGLANGQPYTSTQCSATFGGSNALEFCCVSAGANATYSGLSFNRSGNVFALDALSGEDVSGCNQTQVMNTGHGKKFSVNECSEFPLAVSAQNTAQGEMRNYVTNRYECFPSTSSTFDPQRFWDYTSGVAATSYPGCGIMLFYAPAGTIFTVELTFVYEWCGQTVGSLVTPSPPIPGGLEKANQIAHHVKMVHASNPHEPIRAIAKMVMQKEGGAIGRAAEDILGSEAKGVLRGVGEVAKASGFFKHFRL